MIASAPSRTLLGLFVIVGLCDCSSDTKERPRYAAPIDDAPSTTQVSTLNDTQRKDLCQSYDAYATTYVNLDAVAYLACLPVAIWTTLTEEACNASFDQCVAAFPKPIAVAASAHDVNVCAQNLTQCNATIDQLQGCANINIDRVLDVYGSWSCARVNDAAVRAMAKPMSDLVNVCVNVNDACNNFAAVGPD